MVTGSTVEPDDFTGVSLPTGDGANLWGGDTELRAAATSTVPFRIVGIVTEADASEKYRLRLSDDSGSTFFDDLIIEGNTAVAQRFSTASPSGTEFIFNQGIRISGSLKSESVGVDNCLVWLKVQEM